MASLSLNDERLTRTSIASDRSFSVHIHKNGIQIMLSQFCNSHKHHETVWKDVQIMKLLTQTADVRKVSNLQTR